MRFVIAMWLTGVVVCANAQPELPAVSYSVLLRDDGATWCAYADPADFQAEVAQRAPVESARLTYSSDKLAELKYQVAAASGDWEVIDTYTPAEVGFVLRRTNLLTQDRIEVVQEATLTGIGVGAFRLISVSSLEDGQEMNLPPNTALPEVPVRSAVLMSPFAQVVAELRAEALGSHCKTVGGAANTEESHVLVTAGFSRQAYIVAFPILDNGGNNLLSVACYSLNDDLREKFAEENGTDPVADLSCYVKDMSRENERTMLGLNGLALQHTPAFFWFEEVRECASSSYRMDAWLRGLEVSFEFSEIDVKNKTAKMEVQVSPMSSAANDELTDTSYSEYCSISAAPL